MVLLVMGVTGSGKTTVGRMVAQRLGWFNLEADDFHSDANRAKMHQGIPLTDADRGPWLDAIHAELVKRGAAGSRWSSRARRSRRTTGAASCMDCRHGSCT